MQHCGNSDFRNDSNNETLMLVCSYSPDFITYFQNNNTQKHISQLNKSPSFQRTNG